jgi:hypothetical protein
MGVHAQLRAFSTPFTVKRNVLIFKSTKEISSPDGLGPNAVGSTAFWDS